MRLCVTISNDWFLIHHDLFSLTSTFLTVPQSYENNSKLTRHTSGDRRHDSFERHMTVYKSCCGHLPQDSTALCDWNSLWNDNNLLAVVVVLSVHSSRQLRRCITMWEGLCGDDGAPTTGRKPMKRSSQPQKWLITHHSHLLLSEMKQDLTKNKNSSKFCLWTQSVSDKRGCFLKTKQVIRYLLHQTTC